MNTEAYMAVTTDNNRGFIIVKYGDNEEAIFNPWCSSYTLMEWIRKKCKCGDDIVIDLVDMDGQVTNLSGRTKDYAHELVTARGVYILIRVERLPDNGQFHYTSLLNNLEETNPELMVKLNSLSRPTTRAKNIKQKGAKKTPQQKSRQESANKRPGSTERKKGK
ncbi:uncharacterized protein CXorf65 homolog isoform X2 [Dreissena polymorpha]|uniref:uncharacterized protein CXorf65 homolog isoform X2 n=1 Tax=Dreissena polymorpha TaxID=45954 RepID=UPI002263FF23|nr:uncharacterized protein CXorf65 homolog isoform X2 [Dreissena polymorpha]